jgi:hypothetical protein
MQLMPFPFVCSFEKEFAGTTEFCASSLYSAWAIPAPRTLAQRIPNFRDIAKSDSILNSQLSELRLD